MSDTMRFFKFTMQKKGDWVLWASSAYKSKLLAFVCRHYGADVSMNLDGSLHSEEIVKTNHLLRIVQGKRGKKLYRLERNKKACNP